MHRRGSVRSGVNAGQSLGEAGQNVQRPAPTGLQPESRIWLAAGEVDDRKQSGQGRAKLLMDLSRRLGRRASQGSGFRVTFIHALEPAGCPD